ncbi:hypothetical protein [Nonomuraea sp. NPDC003804]|uniref:hypothetical protein n=1 Tax=Nonomuraea sp. NPDC003804 TaxID=3154547 RepID=UPI0033A9F137
MSEPRPVLIQGGMGVGVSGWRLARAVALTGQLGVVSGTALDATLARRLQLGDPGGHVRRALAAFPVPEIADRVLGRYFVPGGSGAGVPYRPIPRLGLRGNRSRDELTVVANYVEVLLAKEGHDGQVGINYLEKIQLATPAAVYGAMLAGVDHVLMGAGIPAEIPSLLDALAAHRPAGISVTVAGAEDTRHSVGLDPERLLGRGLPALRRPRLLAIVSSHVLAAYLARSPRTRPDGFVLESAVAGGHSAPPRGPFARPDLFELVRRGRDLGLAPAVSPSAAPALTAGNPARLHHAGAAAISLSLDGATPRRHDDFRGYDGVFLRTMSACAARREGSGSSGSGVSAVRRSTSTPVAASCSSPTPGPCIRRVSFPCRRATCGSGRRPTSTGRRRSSSRCAIRAG